MLRRWRLKPEIGRLEPFIDIRDPFQHVVGLLPHEVGASPQRVDLPVDSWSAEHGGVAGTETYGVGVVCEAIVPYEVEVRGELLFVLVVVVLDLPLDGGEVHWVLDN